MLEGLIKRIYNRLIRPITPTTERLVLQNDIPSWREMKILDIETNFPDYETGICSSINKYVGSGDSVVIIGGGKGVSTVKTAYAVGTSGSVNVFEASDRMVDVVADTARINNVSNHVNINHAIVSFVHEGSAELYGSSTAKTIPPSDLPECDVLLMDCEGAEVDILEGMAINPDLIIVETHGVYNSPEQQVRNILLEKEYKIIKRDVESKEEGIFILTAERKN